MSKVRWSYGVWCTAWIKSGESGYNEEEVSESGG